MSPDELEAAQETVEDFADLLGFGARGIQHGDAFDLAFGLGAAAAEHELDREDLNELIMFGREREARRAQRRAQQDWLAHLVDGAFTPN